MKRGKLHTLKLEVNMKDLQKNPFFWIAVVMLLAIVVWPGWLWGHPIWGPWNSTTEAGQTAEQTDAPNTPTPAPAAGTVAGSTDPLALSLAALGFSSREELIAFFAMKGVEPRELSACPFEPNCVRILREKDSSGRIIPFQMNNPTNVTFDGWRCAGSAGGQAKVPPGGPWCVEGVTIRPWR